MKKEKSYLIFIIGIIVFILLVTIVLLTLDLVDITRYIKLSNKYDWLSYIGALLGGLMTLVGVVLTIEYERANNRKELSIAYRPIIDPYVGTDKIEGDIIESEIKQVGDFKGTKTLPIDLVLQNKGRGEAKNIRIIETNILNNRKDLEFCLVGSSRLTMYNEIKHQSYESVSNANLSNAINALASLMILEIYYNRILTGNSQIMTNKPCSYFLNPYQNDILCCEDKKLPDVI